MAHHKLIDNEKNRDEWIERTLKKIPADLKILDAGAGEQKYKKYCKHLQYFSQDFAQYTGSGNEKGLQTGTWNASNVDIISDINSIPVEDNAFDAILCTEVFEHVPNPIVTLKEFSRILKPNGYLLLTAPFCSLTHFAPYHFYSGFNRYFFDKYLPENNFKILEMVPSGNFFDYMLQETRRIPFVIERYCHKKMTIKEKIYQKLSEKYLQKYSVIDEGSDELLTFGYHIFSQKF